MTSRTASPALSAGGKASSQAPSSAPVRKGTPAAGAGNGAASPAAAPAGTASPSLSAGPDLAKLLNLPLRLGVADAGSSGEPGTAASATRMVEGSLFTYDSSFVVLASEPSTSASSVPTTPRPSRSGNVSPSVPASAARRTFTFLRTSQITSVTVLAPTPTDSTLPAPGAPLPPLPTSPAELSSRVDRAVAEERRARARLAPAGSSPDAQGLYDALAKTLPVRWAGTSIVVMDEVVVESPYEPQNVKGAKGSADRVERVKKMVSQECTFAAGASLSLTHL